jgi:hypothetical protein
MLPELYYLVIIIHVSCFITYIIIIMSTPIYVLGEINYYYLLLKLFPTMQFKKATVMLNIGVGDTAIVAETASYDCSGSATLFLQSRMTKII